MSLPREENLDNYSCYELKKYINDIVANNLHDDTRIVAGKTNEVIFLTDQEKIHFTELLNEIRWTKPDPMKIKVAGLVWDGNSDYKTLVIWDNEQWENTLRISSSIE